MSRIEHTDIAKAIGMMLIIASHVGVSTSVQESMAYQVWDSCLNSFYVPLFFLLSGIFEPAHSDGSKFIKRMSKLAKYILIFCVFGFLSTGIIKGEWTLAACKSVTTVWFLFTLAWLTVLMHVVKKLPCPVGMTLLIAAAGCTASYLSRSFFYLGQAMLCFPFYFMAHRFRDFLKEPRFRPWLSISCMVLWVLNLSLFYAPQNISINLVSQNYLSLYVGALCGSLLVIELSKFLVKLKILSYYGRNTVVPMMIHLSLIWLLALSYGTSYYEATALPAYYASAIIICLLSMLVIPLFRNRKYDIFQ